MKFSEPTNDGVIARRALLWVPVAAFGASRALGAPLHALDERRAKDGALETGALAALSFDAFAKRWHALAQELGVAPSTHDESYAAQLAGLIARVPIHEMPKLTDGRSKDGVTAGPSWFLAPIVTVEFRIDAGAELALHNHPPQVVVTLCAEGECTFRHFEIEGDAPPCTSTERKPFAVRETRGGVLKPGRSTSLTRTRDGLHEFVARGRATRMIDFTLPLDESQDFSYVGLEKKPRDAEQRIYDAVWLGREI